MHGTFRNSNGNEGKASRIEVHLKPRHKLWIVDHT